MGSRRKLATRDAIDFSRFKQPSEYTAEFLKKQKIGSGSLGAESEGRRGRRRSETCLLVPATRTTDA